MFSFRYVLFAIFSAMSLSSCSLLEVKLESGVDPLPQEQLSMRIFTREYSSTFFSGVEQTADLIAKGEEKTLKVKALLWKISAEQNLEQTIFQVSPVAAMIDTWAFTAQMAAFFNTGNGKDYFADKSHLAAKTSQQLFNDYQRRMRGLMNNTDFKTNQLFINQYVAKHPLFDISFARVSAFNDWLAYRKISEFDAITTFGTVPEVMSDMSDRMALMATQTPKLMGWRAQLFALQANVNAKDIQNTLETISDTSAKFQKLMAQSPQMMADLAVDLRKELTPLLAQLDVATEKNLAQLDLQRQALEKMVERERLALTQTLQLERQAIAKQADELVQRTVSQVFSEVSQLLKGLILYFVLFLLVVFFAPLSLGVWLGKRIGLKQASRSNASFK